MFNKIVLIGRAGADAKYEEPNQPVTFSLATWRSFRSEEEESGWRTITHWHNIIFWGTDKAKEYISDLIKKGNLYLVEGEYEQNSYEDEEGNKRSYMRVNAKTIKGITKSHNESKNEDKHDSSPEKEETGKDEDFGDDLPF